MTVWKKIKFLDKFIFSKISVCLCLNTEIFQSEKKNFFRVILSVD